MAPPHLHPRSRMTSSLFATTLFASFFVVALPHILPCPAPRVALADGQMAEDGTVRRRRRRRLREEPGGSETVPLSAVAPAEVRRDADGMARFAGMETGLGVGAGSKAGPRRAERECPIPKPGGVVGELLGFGRSEKPTAAPAEAMASAAACPLRQHEQDTASVMPR